LPVTDTTSVAVHPFAVLVAVTVNVPAAVTVMEEVVCPLLHIKVVPAEAVAVRVADVAMQVNTLSVPALTVGATVLPVTDTTSVAVHPFAVLVAVTVNVPAAVTVMEE